MQLHQSLMQGIRGIGRRRRLLFGATATVMTVALIGILVLINVLAVRNHKRWDLTANRDFSLSQQTSQILQGLQQPVQIIGFFGRDDAALREEVESRLKEYTSQSKVVSYRFVDPDADPVTARNYDIRSYGTLVVESAGRRQQATNSDEQAITTAILKATQEETTTVYFLTGQRERSIEGSERDGYSSAKGLLEQDNFLVAPLNLTITGTIPLSNTVLVVADPQTELPAKEAQAVEDYVSRGGRLLVLGNPLAPAPLSGLLGKAGLSWNDDIVVDEQSDLGNPTAPAVLQYPPSPITEDLAGQASVFPTVRTLTQSEQAPANLIITSLLESSSNSRAATDIAGGQIRLAETDRQGPLAFGYSVEGAIGGDGNGPPARIVAIGDADFASNGTIEITQGNGALFRNVVAWLAAQDELISLPSKAPVDRSVFLTAGQSQAIFYGSSLGIPLLVLAAGVGVWWRRR